MPERIRSFVAIELSQETRAALHEVQTRLKKELSAKGGSASGGDVKWIKPENIHLTLKFLGEVPSKKLETLVEAFPQLFDGFARIETEIVQLGVFPNLKRPRVLWAGIEKNAAQVKDLAAHIETAFSKFGFKKEDRPFAAHLTLGRLRSRKNAEALKKTIEAESLHIPFTLESLILFKSTLTSEGPIYAPLATAGLG